MDWVVISFRRKKREEEVVGHVAPFGGGISIQIPKAWQFDTNRRKGKGRHVLVSRKVDGRGVSFWSRVAVILHNFDQ